MVCQVFGTLNFGALELMLYGIDMLTAPPLTTADVTFALIWFARSPRARDALAGAHHRYGPAEWLLRKITNLR